MFGSDRRLVIAIGIGLIGFGGVEGFLISEVIHGYREEQAAQPAQEAATQQQHEPEQGDTERAGVPSVAERLISNPEPRDEQTRAKRDLAAQEANAVWAFWIAVIAAAQAIISTIGILFVWQTLRATRDAVREAGRATKAAQSTANAYLAVERARLVISVKGCNLNRGHVSLTLQAENIGKSTAYVELILSHQLKRNVLGGGSIVSQPAKVAVHAESTKVIGTVTTTMDLSKSPFVGGFIEYRSAFRNDHRTYYCFKITNHPQDGHGGGGPEAHRSMGKGWPEDT